MPNYESNGVIFNNVVAGLNTGGQKLNKAPYKYKNGKIADPQPAINVIDIDWCQATVDGLPEPITSTAQFLSQIGQMNQNIDNLNSSLEQVQESIGGTGTGEGSITADIDEIKSQLQQILSGEIKIGSQIEHVILTAEEYEALEEKDPNTIYFITDETGSSDNPDDPEVVDPISTQLYINGVLTTDRNITLAPGRIYTLEGDVAGTITVDASQIADPSSLLNTELRLKNVRVISSDNYGIRYITPEENKGYKDLVVTLEKNTKNYIVCRQELPAGEDQPGALYSMNNLTIQGPGYLACHNSGGHGIRATEVKLLDPHIYVNSVHDAIHGKKMWICGGTYYVDNANDAFGTGIGGNIKYAYGDITVNNLNGKIFNAKSGTEEGVTKTGELITIEQLNIHNVSNPQKTYTYTEPTSINQLYDSGIVKEYNNVDDAKAFSRGSLVSNTTGMYVATKPFITVEGLVTLPINIPSQISDATIFLSDAIIITNQVGSNASNEPSIGYDATTSNVKIQVVKDTYNAIINQCPEVLANQDADAVKSEHNIKVEIKNDAYLYISATSGDGLDGTDVNITDSKGVLMIHNCGERAIKGNNIIIGPSANTPGGVITIVTDSTSSDYTTFDGAIIVNENCKLYGNQLIRLQSGKIAPGSGYADIFARKGKATDKGTLMVTANELKGIVACNSIGATIAINLDNSANFYYNELVTLDNVTLTNLPAATVEEHLAYPYKKSPINYND